jgi:hypothetical protein
MGAGGAMKRLIMRAKRSRKAIPSELVGFLAELNAPLPPPPNRLPPPEPGPNHRQRLLDWHLALAEQWRGPIASTMSEGDLRWADHLDRLQVAAPSVRASFASCLDHAASGRLTGFAQTAATVAVRTGNPGLLDRAVFALALAIPAGHDFREILASFPIPYHAARRMGLDADGLFLRIADAAPATGAWWLRQFAARPEDAKSLAGFGLAERGDADGFCFVRL